MRSYSWHVLVIVCLAGLLAPLIIYGAGLVQCNPNLPISQPGSCNLCALLKTIQEVFKWVIGLVFIGATGILVYNGVLFYFTQGQPANVKKILDNIKNVVIGIIIVMASFIIVNTILNWFAAPGAPIQFWNNINCATTGSTTCATTPPAPTIPYTCAPQDIAVCIPNASSICTIGGTHARYTCAGGTPQLDACCTSLSWGYACDICIAAPGNSIPLPLMNEGDKCVQGTQKLTNYPNDPCLRLDSKTVPTIVLMDTESSCTV